MIEYAKHEPEDMLVRVTITNLGPEAAPIHVLPTLWFRNTWDWGHDPRRPTIIAGDDIKDRANPTRTMVAKHYALEEYILYAAEADELLFTENETNFQRVFDAPGTTAVCEGCVP